MGKSKEEKAYILRKYGDTPAEIIGVTMGTSDDEKYPSLYPCLKVRFPDGEQDSIPLVDCSNVQISKNGNFLIVSAEEFAEYQKEWRKKD